MSDQSNNGDAQVLHWSEKLFSADDLRRHWKGQRELVLLERALLTPLAQDELRAKGVRVTRQARGSADKRSGPAGQARWSYGQEKPDSAIAAAVAALAREGVPLAALDLGPIAAGGLRSLEAWLGKNRGSVIFCGDAALACCLANKALGLRAAVVASARETGRALTTFGANVLVVEMPGRTYFEVRQILKTAAAATPSCPDGIAKLIEECHAHR